MVRKSLLVVLLLVASGVGGYIYMNTPRLSGEMKEAGDLVPKAEIGGHFTLTNQDGKKVSDTDFKGKKMMVFFGFTNCPNICPVTVAVMTEVMNQLQKPDSVVPIFITIDPERDNPAAIKKFLEDYHPSFVGLTGDKAVVDNVLKEYKIYSAKSTDSKNKNNYMMNHSDLIYLMDEQGNYVTHFSQSNAPEDIVEYIEK